MKSKCYLLDHMLLLLVLPFVRTLVPNICVENATTSGVCCPISKRNGEICGGVSRGICSKLIIKKDFKPFVFLNDDRMDWPSTFFHTLCECKGKYFGITCDECFYGWSGEYCSHYEFVVRRNVLSLSPKDRRLLLQIIDKSLHEPSEYSIFIEQYNTRSDPVVAPEWIPTNVQYEMVANHRFASRATLFTNEQDCANFGFLDFNHNAVGFLTWHRYYMMVWESFLQKIASKYYNVHNFALPYWDWTDLNHCDICTNDLLGAEGDRHQEYGILIHRGSPFHNWTEYCVEPSQESLCYGCHKAGYLGRISRSWNNFVFPNFLDVEFVLSKRNFHIQNERHDQSCESFHMAIEGLCGRPGFNDSRFFMHNRIHNMLDGSMCCSGTSPSDPLFILHHTQIDRLFQRWIIENNPSLEQYPNDGTRPGHGKFSNLVAWLPVVKHWQMFADSKHLGYVYDSYNFGLQEPDK